MNKTVLVIFCINVLVIQGTINDFQKSIKNGNLETQNKIKSFRGVKSSASPYWPCPDPVDILPCICTADVSNMDKLDMDCSAVTSDAELTKVFKAEMSFSLYQTLTIAPTQPTNLNTFTGDTFGKRYFENVFITGTTLQIIQDGTFALSENYLMTLHLPDNQIRVFPFESLVSFTVLEELNLQNNRLTFEENLNIESASLKTLDMSYNMDLYLGKSAFRTCPNLTSVDFSYCTLTELGSNMFGNLESIKTLDLSHNSLTELSADAITLSANTMMYLNLEGNSISVLNHPAIAGFDAQGILNMENNMIVELNKDVWEPWTVTLGNGMINIAGNPLRCGCDIAWMYKAMSLHTAFTDNTTCSDGFLLDNIIPEVLDVHC